MRWLFFTIKWICAVGPIHYLRNRRMLYRFTHGTCTECGIYPPLGGATVCRVCFVRMLAQAQGE